MIDITALSSLVSAFRAETQKDSITPEKLGDILQKILDLLTIAAKDGDLSAIANWKSTISAIGEFVTALSAGTVDADSVHLSFNTVNSATGAAKSYADTIGIQAATTDKAGVMTAQHVKDLNENKKKIADYEQYGTILYQGLLTLSQTMDDQVKKEQTERKSADDSLEQKVASFNSSLNTLSQTVSNNSSEIQYNKKQILNETSARNNTDNALQQNINSLSQTIADNDVSYNDRLSGLERDTDDLYQSVSSLESQLKEKTNTSDMYHIECHVKGNTLKVLGAQDLIAKGLVPVVFRYTVKQSRESEDTAEKNQHSKRIKKDKLRGWHIFFDTKKVMFSGVDMHIRDDYNETEDEKKYYNNPRFLFGKFTEYFEENGNRKAIIVGYGKKTYDVLKGKVFKFALAFADMKINSYTFDFRNLKTNLAIFKVHIEANKDEKDLDKSLKFQYSI